MPPLAFPGRLACLTAALLVFSGCSSDVPPPPPHRAAKAPPTLAGHADFFGGTLLAEVKLGAGIGPMGEPRDNNSGGGGSDQPRAGGYGGSGGGGGGRHRHGGGDSGQSGGDASTSAAGGGSPVRHGAGGPPIMLHIQLTNPGTTPLVVSATDFSSMLGNFVVFPEQLEIGPGAAAEFEPMTSRMGSDFSQVTVNLTLNCGGRVEQKAIVLQVVPPAVAPPAEPAK